VAGPQVEVHLQTVDRAVKHKVHAPTPLG
jgi:hypothetical protein